MPEPQHITRRTLLKGRLAEAPSVSSDGAEAILEISAACLARRGITCMACRDACPEDAIRFMPKLGSPFVPRIDHSVCTRCAECVPSCPVDSISLAGSRENADV